MKEVTTGNQERLLYLSANELDNIDKFSQAFNLRSNQKNNLYRIITSQKFETVIKKKSPKNNT